MRGSIKDLWAKYHRLKHQIQNLEKEREYWDELAHWVRNEDRIKLFSEYVSDCTEELKNLRFRAILTMREINERTRGKRTII